MLSSQEMLTMVRRTPKINYEANNDRNLTKLTTHCLDLYQQARKLQDAQDEKLTSLQANKLTS